MCKCQIVLPGSIFSGAEGRKFRPTNELVFATSTRFLLISMLDYENVKGNNHFYAGMAVQYSRTFAIAPTRPHWPRVFLRRYMCILNCYLLRIWTSQSRFMLRSHCGSCFINRPPKEWWNSNFWHHFRLVGWQRQIPA